MVELKQMNYAPDKIGTGSGGGNIFSSRSLINSGQKSGAKMVTEFLREKLCASSSKPANIRFNEARILTGEAAKGAIVALIQADDIATNDEIVNLLVELALGNKEEAYPILLAGFKQEHATCAVVLSKLVKADINKPKGVGLLEQFKAASKGSKDEDFRALAAELADDIQYG